VHEKSSLNERGNEEVKRIGGGCCAKEDGNRMSDTIEIGRMTYLDDKSPQ
jgi:hypothetical protein